MNKENTKKLLEDFPSLFELHYYRKVPFYPMAFGFECGDGWFNLVYELSSKIAKLDPNVRAVQVKEKYGGLCFYIDSGNEALYDLIDTYEDKSFKTCEWCGSEENVKQTIGWIISLCPSCMEEREKERNG